MTAFFLSESVDLRVVKTRAHDQRYRPMPEKNITRALRFAAILIATLSIAGCALPGPSVMQPAHDAPAGIRVVTHDKSTFDFHDGWQMTWGGIEGRVDLHTASGDAISTDTTLSYWDVSSASSSNGRGNTTSKFLLTVLGIILVIGLAALILYAAFPATDH